MNNSPVSTSIFKLSGSKFLISLTKLIGFKWLFPAIVVVVATMITAFILSDIRIAIVALMILFIVTPMIMALFYINYGLLKNCYLNVINHKVILSEEKILVQIHYIKKSDGENQEEEIREHIIDWKLVNKVRCGINDLLIIISQPEFGFLEIPLSSFQNNQDISKALSIISEKGITQEI